MTPLRLDLTDEPTRTRYARGFRVTAWRWRRPSARARASSSRTTTQSDHVLPAAACARAASATSMLLRALEARAARAFRAASLCGSRAARHRAADRLRPDHAAALARRGDDRGARSAAAPSRARDRRGIRLRDGVLAQIAGEIVSIERCQSWRSRRRRGSSSSASSMRKVVWGDGLAPPARSAGSTASSFMPLIEPAARHGSSALLAAGGVLGRGRPAGGAGAQRLVRLGRASGEAFRAKRHRRLPPRPARAGPVARPLT